MLHFINSLTPEQLALIAGFVSPVIHYLWDKWRTLTTSHDWVLSFALPLLGTVAVFLASNASFTHAFPLYATVYATGQAFYAIAIRYWKANNELKVIKANAPEASF